MNNFLKLKLNKILKGKSKENLNAYDAIVKGLDPKAHSETQELTFNTMRCLLEGGAEKTKIIRLYSRNGLLYEKRAYLSFARLIIRFGRKHGYIPVAKKYGYKIPFDVFCNFRRADICPPLSSIAKNINKLNL